MKRIILAISILSLMFTIPVFAATSALSDGTGTITLTDATGGGPGVIGVAVSNDSYVAYTGDTGAGGYTANTTGQTMAAQAYSKKPIKMFNCCLLFDHPRSLAIQMIIACIRIRQVEPLLPQLAFL